MQSYFSEGTCQNSSREDSNLYPNRFLCREGSVFYQIKFEEFIRIQIKKVYKINIDISNIRINNIFKEIIKMEILIKSSKIFHSNTLSYNDSIKIFEFFSQNLTIDSINTFIIKKNKNH